jgi:hypothetical protein
VGFLGEVQSTNTLTQVSDMKADSLVRVDTRLRQSAVMTILRYGVHLGREPRSSDWTSNLIHNWRILFCSGLHTLVYRF